MSNKISSSQRHTEHQNKLLVANKKNNHKHNCPLSIKAYAVMKVYMAFSPAYLNSQGTEIGSSVTTTWTTFSNSTARVLVMHIGRKSAHIHSNDAEGNKDKHI